MLTQKAPYHPSVTLIITKTRFGMQETSHPKLYESPIPNKYILRVDTLDILRDLWGDTILMARDKVYSIVSGNVDDVMYRKLILSYYAKYSAFCNYITEKSVFGDNNCSLMYRILNPVHTILESNLEEVMVTCKRNGGKYLMESHGYVYYAFTDSDVPIIRGSKVIC